MLAAGSAGEEGRRAGPERRPWVKTSLAPGLARRDRVPRRRPDCSRTSTSSGFNLVGYGCTTCIGNSGPLDPRIEEALTTERPHRGQRAVRQPQLRGARAPEHQGELPHEPAAGRGVRARRPHRHRSDHGAARQAITTARTSICATSGRRMQEIGALLDGVDRRRFPRALRRLRRAESAVERDSQRRPATLYEWDAASTYIQEPPFFGTFSMQPARLARRSRRSGAGDLRRFGHDRPHQSGRRDQARLAGGQLPAANAAWPIEDFNSYGSRRGNDEVMMRGTFANVRIKNLMVPGVEGGVTDHQPDGER